MKPAHRRGTYYLNSKRLRQAAWLNPDTVCQATHCKGWGQRTIHEHPPTRTGKPPRWDAGHTIAGDPYSPLRPEVDVCNRAEGGMMTTNRRRNKTTPLTTTRDW